MRTCFRCTKQIKGEMVVHRPPLFMVQMGIDFERFYHPKCYEREEKEAERELKEEYLKEKTK